MFNNKLKAMVKPDIINPKCVTLDEMHKVYDRHKDDEYMADLINWENLYAR